MNYRRFKNAKEFYNGAYSVLLKHEAQNSLPLGNMVLGNKGGEPEGWRNTANWYMATVSDGCGGVLLTAIMTPPFNITLYETDNLQNDRALDCLCENIRKDGVAVPGVTSENSLALRFAKAYTKRAGTTFTVHKNMRIYTLDKVDERVPLTGTVRHAQRSDLYYLPYWNIGFSSDCGLGVLSLDDAFFNIERDINHKTLFVLEDNGTPVSMASALREIVTGRCIGRVYTPSYFRKRGYASSCVAQVSKIVLEMGYQYASLFTDLSNPVSNSIYQKIGYKPTCDYNEITFVSKD